MPQRAEPDPGRPGKFPQVDAGIVPDRRKDRIPGLMVENL